MEKPSGTVTMVFSDIEGSTRLLERVGDGYAPLLARHHAIVRAAIAAHDGSERGTEGDAFFVAFRRASDALLATADIQRALASEEWPDGAQVRVRMGVHTGEPREFDPGDYTGLDVHRAARICSAAHGGQVLCSDATLAVVGEPPPGLVAEDLGEHRLKDLSRPMRLFQVLPVELQRPFPPPRTLDPERTNLPALTTALIGRRDEIARLRALLEQARLVTLTGPGGAGKTRTALTAAAETSDAFSGGAYVAFLAGVADANGVLPAIAVALGVQETPGRRLLDAVVEALQGPPFLLVLDNLEHLPDAAGLIADLLARVPALKVLATSRAPLHLAAEHELELPPLPADDGVRLFLERARALRADFAAPEPAVAAVCERLDGLPLAIELAAARTRVLSAEALLDRLDRRLDLLVGGARDLPDRQRTLRATIAWSHCLLPAPEQELLRRLAVFAGGFGLDLLAPVTGADELALEALVEHSLVRAIAPAAGEPRFLMLETIREFALEELEAHGEAEAQRERHAEAIVDLLERADTDIGGARQLTGLDRIDAELDNVRAAAGWIRARGRSDLELRLAAAIGRYGLLRGRWAEVRGWVEDALVHGPANAPDQYARALESSILLVRWDGDAAGADARSRELLAFADGHGDRKARAYALVGLAFRPSDAGDLAAALALLEEGAALAREIGDDWVLGMALTNLGDTALRAEDFDIAGAHFAESLAIGERLGASSRATMARQNLATVRLAEGDPAAAREELERTLREGRALAYPDIFLYGTATMAALALAEGDPEHAARVAGTVDAAFASATMGIEGFEARRHAELIDALRASLGDERFEQLHAEGRATAPDDVIDAFLAEG